MVGNYRCGCKEVYNNYIDFLILIIIIPTLFVSALFAASLLFVHYF